MLVEKGSELSHAIRRAETNERELRKLKIKIQESKKLGSMKKVEGINPKSMLKIEPKYCKATKNQEMKDVTKKHVNRMDEMEDGTGKLFKEESNEQDDSDNRFSEIFFRTVVDKCNSMDPQCCDKSEKVILQVSDKSVESTCYNINEAAGTGDDSEEKCEYVITDAVYASVNKNKKKPKEQQEKECGKS